TMCMPARPAILITESRMSRLPYLTLPMIGGPAGTSRGSQSAQPRLEHDPQEPEPVSQVGPLLRGPSRPFPDRDRHVDDAQSGTGRPKEKLRVVELVLGECDLGESRRTDRAIAVGDVADLRPAEQVDEPGVDRDPCASRPRVAAALGLAHPARA